MIWIEFVVSSFLVVVSARALAQYGDVISVRTRLGGLFIGTLLLAAATSLPELLTTVSSINQGVPNLAAGNIFGSNMFNMFILAVLDLLNRSAYMLRRVAYAHTLTASLAISLAGLSVFFMLRPIDVQIGWMGVDSLALLAGYIGGVRLIQSNNIGGASAPELTEEEIKAMRLPRLRTALIGFAIAPVVLMIVTPFMVRSAVGIADALGVGTGFVGTTLVAIVTSLPEVVTTITAVRIGAYDLAVGNLFGSNVFNIFILAVTDFFYMQGRFLGAIDPSMAVVGIFGLLLTSLALADVLARAEHRRFSFVGILIIVGYFAGMWLVYTSPGGGA